MLKQVLLANLPLNKHLKDDPDLVAVCPSSSKPQHIIYLLYQEESLYCTNTMMFAGTLQGYQPFTDSALLYKVTRKWFKEKYLALTIPTYFYISNISVPF